MINQLYELLMEGIKSLPYFYNSDQYKSFELYLQSLQHDAKKLWLSFRENNIKVDYSDKNIQAIYLLRYFPHYVEMSLSVFRLLSSELTQRKKLKICFFGSGPCPEVIGLHQLLEENSSITHQIDVRIFDISSEGWKNARNIIEHYLIPKFEKDHDFTMTAHHIDLCKDNSIHECNQRLNDIFDSSDIFMFQNCLNELWNIDSVKRNIDELFSFAQEKSLFIINDLANYPSSREILNNIQETLLTSNGVVIHSGEEKMRSFLPVPKILCENLLTGESYLIPRSNIHFVYQVIEKNSEQFFNILDDIPF